MKRCSKCKEEKEFSEFCLNKNSKNGYNYSCKKCVNKKINKQGLLFEIDRIKNKIRSEEVINGETWKDIPNYEGYQASDLGNIRSKDRIVEQKNGRKYLQKGRLMSKNSNGNGYLSVMLSFKGRKSFRRYVHRLVALTFLKGDESLHVDHINFDKSDNKVSNLRFVTQRENNHFYQESVKENNTCEYIGVVYSKEKDLYFSTFSVNGDNYNLGSYKVAEDAKKAYDEALKNWLDKKELPYLKKRVNKKTAKNIFFYNNKYYVKKGFKYKAYDIKTFNTEEEAVKCLEEFNKFIKINEDKYFPDLVKEFKKLYKGE